MSVVRYYTGKALELIGMMIVGAALLAGLGLTPTGEPSMGQEMVLLGIGGMLFTLGWMLERGQQS